MHKLALATTVTLCLIFTFAPACAEEKKSEQPGGIPGVPGKTGKQALRSTQGRELPRKSAEPVGSH